MDFLEGSLFCGIPIFVGETRKFKTSTLIVQFTCDLGRSPTENAVLPFLLRRGTRLHPSLGEMNRRLEGLYGSECEVGVSKSGERQILTFRLETPGEEYLPEEGVMEQALATLAEVVLDPPLDGDASFRGDHLEGEKDNLRVRQEAVFNDKAAYARLRCVQEMCRRERYATARYGRKEDLPGITGAGLYARYREILRESPVNVFLVGNVPLERALTLLEGAFDAGERRPREIEPTEIRSAAGEWREVRETQNLEQARLCLGYRTGMGRGDYRFWALAMANGILGGFPHAKLFRRVREEHGLAYSVASSLDAGKGLLFIDAGINAADYERTREICEKQLADVREGNFSDEEMEKVRAGMLRALRSSLDRPRALIAAFLEGLINGRKESPGAWERHVRAVARDDVVEAAAGIGPDTAYFLHGGE